MILQQEGGGHHPKGILLLIKWTWAEYNQNLLKQSVHILHASKPKAFVEANTGCTNWMVHLIMFLSPDNKH